MATPNITQMGIIPMLATIMEGEISEDDLGTFEEIKSTEKKRGVITSPASRRLLVANSIFAKYIGDLIGDHNQLHCKDEEDLKLTGHDCATFQNTVAHLLRRQDLLRSLLWQAIAEEHPQVITSSVNIRRGWFLVSEGDEWINTIPIADGSALVNNFISRITDIVCGRYLKVNEDDLDPVAQDEEVVGSLDNERIQTLHSMITEIRDELSKRLPPGMMDSDSKVIGDMTGNEVNRLRVLAMRYKKLSDLTTSLFWCGVRDTVPAATDLPSIGIRRAWDVVKCIPEETEEGIEMVMTPMGPAIVINIPVRP